MPHKDIPMVSGTEFAAISAAVSEMFGSEATSEVFNRYGFSDQLLHDPSFQLPNAEYTRFLEACARVTGEHLFGAKIGDSVPFSELGLYGRFVTAAPTLSIALCRAARGLRYHETGSRLVCECEGSSINLRYFPATPNAVGSWHQTDGVAAMLINLIRSYEGSDWQPSSIGVPAAKGERRLRLDQFFDMNVNDRNYGADVTGYIAKPAEGPSTHIANTSEFCWRDLRRMVVERPPETFAGTLRKLIVPLVRAGFFDLEKISRNVGVAERTIQRRLADDGTTFGRLLQEVRRDWAEELLLTTALSLAEIAPLVGYSSKQHFIRGFRSWTGSTPAAFRVSLPDE